MARLVLAVVFVALVLGAVTVVALGLRAIARRGAGGEEDDMAENSFLPKLAYALLLALVLYVAFNAAGV